MQMPWTGDANAIDVLRGLKRVSLAHLPTPVEPLDRLSALLGGPRVWVKRDDCTGLGTGGNKTRKIEFLMADALAKGADTVVTVGAIQSNHARQVAAASARFGLRCVLRIIGISAGDKAERAIRRVRTPQLAAAEILGMPSKVIGQTPIVIDDRFVGEDYGIPTPECVRAIELLARKEGLLLDPVYTGKAMAGLLTLVRENYFSADVRNLLFWHTGGSVALHAYPEMAGHFENATSRS
jgi:1-aminocyclopropane-1-carboxylate deaminase/D-cysteine desulfhydrase-like pyridoxal-dependent ACC family enzyme